MFGPIRDNSKLFATIQSEVEECLKCQMCLFPRGVFSVHEKYRFTGVNGVYL